MFGIKNDILSAAEQVPGRFIQGIYTVIKAPPAWMLSTWNGLSDTDKELFAQAGMSALRVGAKMLIAADKGGKMEF